MACYDRRDVDIGVNGPDAAPVERSRRGYCIRSHRGQGANLQTQPEVDVSRSAAGEAGCEHGVGFYENDEFLVTTILEHLAPALEAGESAVVIATPEHRWQIEEALDGRVGDPATGSLSRLVTMDAAATLERFMADGMPDAGRFEAAMTEVIDAATTGSAPVRVYGEMVAVLWDQGNVAAAIAVEDLWNDLGSSRPFALLCGYPMRAFGREGTAAFRDVCRRHGRVIPSESYSSLSDPDERLRAVALLQGEVAASGRERSTLQDGHAQLEKALDRLRELERVRKEFVAMVVHDIRGPAAIISASLDLLQDGWDDLDENSIRDLLAGAAGNAVRIERLAADMLSLSRLDAAGFSYHLGAFALDRVVDDAVGEVVAATARRIRVVVTDPLPDAFADEQRQRQVLGNLLSNAVKFSADDTEVVVTIARVGDELSVSVCDQGVGIAAADQATLFHPFTRVRSGGARVDGFGLGLYTAKVLVEGQGGRIRVDSTPGVGSTFTYTVPVAGLR